jgi:hypothetical protein
VAAVDALDLVAGGVAHAGEHVGDGVGQSHEAFSNRKVGGA